MNIAVFISGNGSNFQALIDAVASGTLSAQIVACVSDHADAFGITRAERAGIPTLVLAPSDCSSRQAWEEAICEFLATHDVEAIVLAGFMRIVGATLLRHFPQRIINIHPSLLPQFPGRHGIADAYHARVPETGVTVHVVDEGIDTGPILAQQAIAIAPEWTLEQLETQIHQIEHALYPAVLQRWILSQQKEQI